MTTVYDRVKSIVADKLDVDDNAVVPGASFVDDLNADSLDLAELIMAFEEEFSKDDNKIEISDEEAGQIITIQNAHCLPNGTWSPGRIDLALPFSATPLWLDRTTAPRPLSGRVILERGQSYPSELLK